MNRMLKCAVTAVIALAFGSAAAQNAPVTGRTVLDYAANPPGFGWGTGVATSTAGTFHAGGVAACDGCHVMHNASNGVARSTRVAPWTNAVPAFLLQGTDQSSTCLICHGGTTTGAGVGSANAYRIANVDAAGANVANLNYSPGGDFGWLKLAGATAERRGHNIVASDFNFVADVLVKTAPGGTFSVSATGTQAFACSNCHDPHGRYRMQGTGTQWSWAGPVVAGGLVDAITQPIFSSGSYGALPTGTAAVGAYRLLGGYGYSPASATTSAVPFTNNPPVAVAPMDYNHKESKTPGSQVRVAYGAGMSEWCQNCHNNIHLDNYTSGAMGASGLKHPAGNGAVLKPGQYGVYNTYVSSGVFNGTNAAGEGYTSLVPFENSAKLTYNGHTGNNSDIIALQSAMTGADTQHMFTATGQSNVMCLTCHRAHASGFNSMVRWNNDDTFITNSSAFVDSQTRTDEVLKAGYYGRVAGDFGAFQRSLCNKCHGKD